MRKQHNSLSKNWTRNYASKLAFIDIENNMQKLINYKMNLKIWTLSFIFASLLFGSFASLPVNAQTQGGYDNNPVTDPTGYQIVPKTCVGTTENPGECGWFDLLQLARNIMAFLFWLSASIAVLSFAYAGFLYLTAFGEMGKVEQAHGIFSKVIVGFLFVFLAWLIVATILKTMGVDKAFSLVDFGRVDTIDIQYRN